MDEEDQKETSQLLRQQRNEVNNMEARHDHILAKRFRLFHSITVLLGIVLVVLMLVWIFKFLGGVAWTSHPNIQFNWHPLLMTIGMIFLYSQSIMVYRVARNTKKRPLKLWHATIHFLIFILTIIGLQAVFDSHNLNVPPIPNMYSLHSWIGLTTVILFACQFVAGFVSFLFPGLPMDLRAAYMHVHTSFGVAGFVLALITAFLGLYEKTFFQLKFEYANLDSQALLINCIGVVLVIFGTLVLYLINEATYKRVPLPEDDMLLSPTQPEVAE